MIIDHETSDATKAWFRREPEKQRGNHDGWSSIQIPIHSSRKVTEPWKTKRQWTGYLEKQHLQCILSETLDHNKQPKHRRRTSHPGFAFCDIRRCGSDLRAWNGQKRHIPSTRSVPARSEKTHAGGNTQRRAAGSCCCPSAIWTARLKSPVCKVNRPRIRLKVSHWRATSQPASVSCWHCSRTSLLGAVSSNNVSKHFSQIPVRRYSFSPPDEYQRSDVAPHAQQRCASSAAVTSKLVRYFSFRFSKSAPSMVWRSPMAVNGRARNRNTYR